MGGSHGGNPFRGQPSQHPFRHLVRRSDVRSLLLGSSLLEAFNPIDGPEVLGQVLLNDPGVGHVEVALVSPVLAPGIAHLRCVGGLEVCWPSVSSNGKPKKKVAVYRSLMINSRTRAPYTFVFSWTGKCESNPLIGILLGTIWRNLRAFFCPWHQKCLELCESPVNPGRYAVVMLLVGENPSPALLGHDEAFLEVIVAHGCHSMAWNDLSK